MAKKTEVPEIEEAPKTTRRTRKPATSFSVTLDDGSVIDLDSFNFGEGEDVTLTKREKLFLFWYTYPASSTYHDKTKSARKAGYAKIRSSQTGYELAKSTKLAPIIAKIENETVKTGVEDAFHRIIKRKIARAEFDGLSFYNIREYTDREGNPYTRVSVKKPEELTEEQRLCIDGIDFVGNMSIPNFRLPNRTTEENKIIELYKDLTGEKKNGDEFEVETTAEIIKGNLQVKTKVIKKNEELAELADLKSNSIDRTEED